MFTAHNIGFYRKMYEFKLLYLYLRYIIHIASILTKVSSQRDVLYFRKPDMYSLQHNIL